MVGLEHGETSHGRLENFFTGKTYITFWRTRNPTSSYDSLIQVHPPLHCRKFLWRPITLIQDERLLFGFKCFSLHHDSSSCIDVIWPIRQKHMRTQTTHSELHKSTSVFKRIPEICLIVFLIAVQECQTRLFEERMESY